MTIFDVPAINATFNGLSTPPIWSGRLDLDSARSQALPLIFLTVIPVLPSRLIAVEKWANSFSRSGFMFTVTGVYFMLYQCFPSTHFDELKKRHEVKIEAANH